MDLKKIFDAVVANECGPTDPCKFSWAGGESGVSFGPIQWDYGHNADARHWILTHGFTEQEMSRIGYLLTKGKTCTGVERAELDAANAKLAALRAELYAAQFDYFSREAERVFKIPGLAAYKASDVSAALVLDYHNQFGISPNGLFLKVWGGKTAGVLFYGRERNGDDAFLIWKLTATRWGQKRPDDVRRRHEHILNTFAEA